MVTDIILDRKSSQGDSHRPLQRINLLKKAIETRDQNIACEEGKWKLTQIQNYDYDEFCANEKSDQNTIFEILTEMPPQHEPSSCDPPPQYDSPSRSNIPPQHEPSSCDPPPQYDSPSEFSPPPEYESPPRSNILSQDESSLYDAPPQYDSSDYESPPR